MVAESRGPRAGGPSGRPGGGGRGWDEAPLGRENVLFLCFFRSFFFFPVFLFCFLGASCWGLEIFWKTLEVLS